LGFELFAQEGHRLPELTTVVVPEHLQPIEAEIRSRLRSEYLIEVGGGLGPVTGKVWRVGLMGGSARPESVDRFIEALSAVIG
jgi:alanine-glyoxylate transaminase/serine-glyoxylate transaminase/serine-pyruvate transaminase